MGDDYIAACESAWVAYQYGDRDPVVKHKAMTYQHWLIYGWA